MGDAGTESIAERRVTQRLPVPPRILLRVVQVAAEPDSTAADLAKLINMDPTLTAQVLRAANAAYYGLRQRIDTVHHAVAFMGMGAVRNLVLCIGMVQLVRPDEAPDFPIDLFWECSVRRASAAVCLARRIGVEQPEEFFTLGLCQDIGILIQLGRDPAFPPAYAAILGRLAAERLELEHTHAEPHPALGADYLEACKLPRELTEAVRFHHTPDESPSLVRGHCLIAAAAEAIADLLHAEDKAMALEVAQRSLEALELSPELLRSIVDEVVADVAEAAAMLQLSVGSQPTYEQIVAVAGDALFSLTVTRPSAPENIEQAFVDQQRAAEELQQQNEELQRQAATDPLTGLANRRMMDDVIEREMAQAQRREAQLTVLMLDIDHFKRVNDTHGHQAGDHVLQHVADVIRQSLRKCDFSARYGGEEFAVLLPFSDEAGARVVAKRIRAAIEGMRLDWEGTPLPITVSIGGVTVPGTAAPDAAERAVGRADTALYVAKDEGRNCIRWAPSSD